MPRGKTAVDKFIGAYLADSPSAWALSEMHPLAEAHIAEVGPQLTARGKRSGAFARERRDIDSRLVAEVTGLTTAFRAAQQRMRRVSKVRGSRTGGGAGRGGATREARERPLSCLT